MRVAGKFMQRYFQTDVQYGSVQTVCKHVKVYNATLLQRSIPPRWWR